MFFPFLFIFAHAAAYPEYATKNVDNSESMACVGCLAGANFLFDLAARDQSGKCPKDFVIGICEILHLQNRKVCEGLVRTYGDIVLYVGKNMKSFPEVLCEQLLPGCGGPAVNALGQWKVTLPDNKPLKDKPILPEPSQPVLRVLHLTDIHLDLAYTEGAESDCGEPVCCRKPPGSHAVKRAAGKWGMAEKCDMPLRTLEHLFQHLSTRNDFDYILWTGDATAHNIWEQTKQDQLTVLRKLNELFLKYFPNKLIISTVGNHESSPANSYPPRSANVPGEYSSAWLFDEFSSQWTKFGIGENTEISESIKTIASYMTKPYPGFRMISLNSMYCQEENFWLYLNSTDPDNILDWLIKQLKDAEENGDKVHIVSHIPPGVNCLKQWSSNFYNIVNRYQNTICGLFYGHWHYDMFSVFYDHGDLSKPSQVAYVGPSVSPTSQPAFRIYTVDGNYTGSSFRVLDHETYIMNVDQANVNDDPKWVLEYTAKEAYNMSSLLPEAWSDLIQRFLSDDGLFQKYYNHYTRDPSQKPCHGECKRKRLCELRQAGTHDASLCEDIDNKISEEGNGDDATANGPNYFQLISSQMTDIFALIPEECKETGDMSI